ncbi:SidA/IucD/PvdA family monooxygenase [Agrobacterium tumefaciens]|uniref:SidA/IucD/PvdA family monooxygenase n=1 Tax=Agrobacterium tumefaciens TaxID=358 RepID=A0AAJ4TC04_AGRTU|nr:SidA/IucD/PvdA family monooxygenase [Agrobacterium tumefaciens]
MAVIGAGAKGVAIAAKAAALNQHYGSNIEVTLIEKSDVGGNWSGHHGYTDGEQQICTPAERDVGFPYDHSFNEETSAHMQSEYSWMAYSVKKTDAIYSDWINRGSVRPSHREFSNYLKYVAKESGAKIERDCEVTGLSRTKNGKRWEVSVQQSPTSTSKLPTEFDGIVFTGPGPARDTFGGFRDTALFNADSFWSKRNTLRGLMRNRKNPIVIVGGGGAAAAIAAWLVSNGFHDDEIVFLAQQPTFYMRTGGFFENRVFDDEELWDKLGKREKDDFVSRITRSVVWESVADKLAEAKNITLSPGRATSITSHTLHGENYLEVKFNPASGGPPNSIEASIVIDAAGFDTWWFKKFLPSPWATWDDSKLADLAAKMDYNLRLPLRGYGNLHAPTVSQSVGPGFTSLMVLGRMADRILATYVAQ